MQSVLGLHGQGLVPGTVGGLWWSLAAHQYETETASLG